MTDAEADALCDGVIRLLKRLRAWQLEQTYPIKRDPYHDLTMRAIYEDDR